MNRRRLSLGIGTLALLGALLLLYAALHSPVRRPIWEALFDGCRMFCFGPNLRSGTFDAVTALWLLAASLIAAVPLSQRLLRGGLERLVGWGLLAYGLLVIPAAIVAFLGDRIGIALLQPPLGPLVASLPAIVVLGVAVRRGWRPAWPSVGGVHLTPAVLVLGGLAIAALVVQAGIAIRYPITGFDALGYHAPLAVLFWQEGSITSFLDRFGGTPVLAHPGGGELWQGLLLLIGGEPLAIVGQLPFALLGAAGVALFARRLGLRAGAALVAALVFLLTPMVAEQAALLRNDVMGAALVVCAAALLADRAPATLPARLLLTCLALGLMAATKLALLPAIGALGLVVLWRAVEGARSAGDSRRVWGALGLGLVVAALAVAPWWIRNLLREGNPLFPLDLPLVGGGIPWTSPPDERYVPHPLLWPLYPWLEEFGPADGFGGAFAVGIVPGVIAAWFLARRRPLAVLGILVLVTLPVWVLFDRREPRFLLGIAALACALIPFLLVGLQRRWRGAAMAVLTLAALVTVGAHWTVTTPNVTADRAAFYDKEWGVDPVASRLPESEGLLLDDRCGGFGRLYPWFGANRQRHLARVSCEATADQILRVLRRERLSRVVVFVPEADRAARMALYPSDAFTIEHESRYEDASGTFSRLLLRWTAAPEPDPA